MIVLFVVIVVILSAIWVGFDHRTTKRRYGWDIISKDPVGWVAGVLAIWIIAFPWYLVRRHQQITRPMWPMTLGRPADFEAEDGSAWHRDAGGGWSLFDDALGWTPVSVNNLPEGLELVDPEWDEADGE